MYFEGRGGMEDEASRRGNVKTGEIPRYCLKSAQNTRLPTTVRSKLLFKLRTASKEGRAIQSTWLKWR